MRELRELLGRCQSTRTPLIQQLAGQRTHSGLGATAVGLRVAAAAAVICLLLSVEAVAERLARDKRCRRRLVARALRRRRQSSLKLRIRFTEQRRCGHGSLTPQLINRLGGASGLSLRDALQLMQRALQLLIVLRGKATCSAVLLGGGTRHAMQRTSTSIASSSLTRCCAVSRSRSACARSSRSAESASCAAASAPRKARNAASTHQQRMPFRASAHHRAHHLAACIGYTVCRRRNAMRGRCRSGRRSMRRVALVGHHSGRGVCVAGSGGARYLARQGKAGANTRARERSSWNRTCHVAARHSPRLQSASIAGTMMLRMPDGRHGTASALQQLRRQACAFARTLRHACADPLHAASCGRPRAEPRAQPCAAAGRGENEKHARAEQLLQQRTAKALDASIAAITRLIGVGDMYGGVGGRRPALPPGEVGDAAAFVGAAKRVSFRCRAKTKRQVAQARVVAAAVARRAARPFTAAAPRAEARRVCAAGCFRALVLRLPVASRRGIQPAGPQLGGARGRLHLPLHSAPRLCACGAQPRRARAGQPAQAGAGHYRAH